MICKYLASLIVLTSQGAAPIGKPTSDKVLGNYHLVFSSLREKPEETTRRQIKEGNEIFGRLTYKFGPSGQGVVTGGPRIEHFKWSLVKAGCRMIFPSHLPVRVQPKPRIMVFRIVSPHKMVFVDKPHGIVQSLIRSK